MEKYVDWIEWLYFVNNSESHKMEDSLPAEYNILFKEDPVQSS
jgi:hypothetical protein